MDDTNNNVSTSRIALGFALIVFATLICFYPTLNNGLLEWDDSGYILENTNIRSISAETLYWAFTTFYVNYWAPLTWISLAIDYSFWGLNPIGYHLTNNIIHALNSGLFFLLALTLLRCSIPTRRHLDGSRFIASNREFYCALLAALLFSLHPLRVESVAWATERKDVLCVFFGLLALIFYFRHAMSLIINGENTGYSSLFIRSKYYWLSVFFYCLSLLSKSMLVILPVVLLVFDWFPLRRYSRETIAGILFEKIPLVLFAAIASILTIKSQGESLMSFEQTNLMSRILIACKSVMLYLWMTVWPFDISPFYVHPGKSISTIGIEYFMPVILCFIITVACIYTVRKWPVILAIWVVYLLTLFPVLGLTQTGPQGMAARFTYFPGMAIAFIISLGITSIIVKNRVLKPTLIICILFVSVVLTMYCSVTRKDISYWKNDITLWTRVIDLKPHSTGRAYFQRGYAYLSKEQYENALNDANEALKIAISKNYNRTQDIQLLRGRILKQMGNLEEAIAAFTNAINSDSSQSRFIYFAERGNIYFKMGKTDLANEDFKQAAIPR